MRVKINKNEKYSKKEQFLMMMNCLDGESIKLWAYLYYAEEEEVEVTYIKLYEWGLEQKNYKKALRKLEENGYLVKEGDGYVYYSVGKGIRKVLVAKYNLTEEIEKEIKGKLSKEGYELWKMLNGKEPWDLVEVEESDEFRELIKKGVIEDFGMGRYVFLNTAGLEGGEELPLGVEWDRLFKEVNEE